MKKALKWSVFALVWVVAIFYCNLPYFGTLVDFRWYSSMCCVNILCLCIFGDAVTKGKFLEYGRRFWLEK